jgi:hypothetical protein
MTTPDQRRSRRQERDGAREFGGRVTPGSGNGWVAKNDVITPKYSIEYKTTTSESFILRLAALRTAERHALLDGREMIFMVDLAGREYAVVTKDFMMELAAAWEMQP